MPFARLLDYYANINKMFAGVAPLYLVDIVESSHGSQFAVATADTGGVKDRIGALLRRSAPRPALRASDEINAMLVADNRSAIFSDDRGENVIAFPGRADSDVPPIRIRGSASIVGELYHISGTKDDVRVRLSTDQYGVVFCVTSKDLARSLRDFLFENVRVSGRGVWTRAVSGDWAIQDFTITDFAAVKSDSLREAVDKIRNANIAWPTDLIGVIDDLNERNGTER